MNTSNTSQPYTARGKFIIIVICVALLLLGYMGFRVLGDTTLGITLSTNSDLERGLTAHWTFDGTYYAPGGAGTSPLSDYTYSRQITLQSSKIGTTTSAFPILATSTITDLKSTGNGGHVQSSTGVDIVFADEDGNVLDYYQEYYASTTGQFVYWVEAPISSTTNQTIYMHYGKSGASDLSDAPGTWDSLNTAIAYDLDQSPASVNCATNKEACDRTTNVNNGDASDMESGDLVAGLHGSAYNFDNSSGASPVELVTAPYAASFNSPSFSVVAWVNRQDVGTANEVIAGREQGTSNNDTWILFYDYYTSNHYRFYVTGTVSASNAAGTTNASSDLNKWAFIVGTFDGTNARVYRNSTLEATGAALGGSTYNTSETTDVNVGAEDEGATYNAGIDGQIDSFRYFTRALHVADIITMYNNQSSVDSFMTFSSEDTNAAPGITVTDRIGGLNATSSQSIAGVDGAVGQGLKFDGINDFVGSPNVGSGIKTVAFWVNFSTTSASQKIINIDGADQIETNSSKNIVATSFPGTTAIYVDGSSSSANIPREGEWRHVVITDTTGVSASTFEIGRVGGTYGGFSIDDVRLYNRTLSEAEVKRLYELGATTRIGMTLTSRPNLNEGLLAHWTFDTGQVSMGYGPVVGSGTTTPSSHAAVTSSAGDNNGLEGTSGTAPTDVTTSNNGYRTDASSGSAWSQDNCTSVFPQSENDQHRFYDFNLSIPEGASISGIEVALEGKAGNTTGTETWCTGLSWNGGTNWTSGKEGPDLIASDRVDMFGGSADTWGRTWSASEFSNTNFRLMVMPDQDTSQADTYSLDYIGLQVYYRAPGGGIESAHDRSGAARTATSSGSSVNSVPGVMGQGISLDGLTAQMLRATSTTALSTTLTFAAWFHLDPNTSSNQHFISAYEGDAGRKYYTLRADVDLGPLRLHGVTDDSGSWADTDVLGSTLLMPDMWYHGVFTVNNDELTLYLNGEQEAYEVVAGVSTMNVDGFRLGGGGLPWAYDPLSGSLDDVRVYNRALSAAEVKQLYQLGATTRIATTPSTNSALNQGLVAYWTMDGSMVDLSQLNAELRDRAGSNHMNWQNHATTTLPGVAGQAVKFDGINDFSGSPNVGSGLKTIAFWVNFSTTSISQKIISIDGIDQIETNSSNNIVATSFPGTNVIYVDGSSASANIPRVGEWRHVVITDTTGVNGSTFEIGRVGSTYGGFSIDDVRLYNRVLSQDEIKRLYELGK